VTLDQYSTNLLMRQSLSAWTPTFGLSDGQIPEDNQIPGHIDVNIAEVWFDQTPTSTIMMLEGTLTTRFGTAYSCTVMAPPSSVRLTRSTERPNPSAEDRYHEQYVAMLHANADAVQRLAGAGAANLDRSRSPRRRRDAETVVTSSPASPTAAPQVVVEYSDELT
jgi:hypothetical protein